MSDVTKYYSGDVWSLSFSFCDSSAIWFLPGLPAPLPFRHNLVLLDESMRGQDPDQAKIPRHIYVVLS